MYKICIWTPTATHHQSAFHTALSHHQNIDLQVRYFNKISKERLALGWEDKQCTQSFEQRTETLGDALASLEDFSTYIHIISGNGYTFTKELITYCIENDLKWINWTERSGGGLFRLLRENSTLFKIIFPLYQRLYNKTYARQIQRYALGTFVSGVKAEEDYLKRGVKQEKIRHLYYALEALTLTTVIPKEFETLKFKYYFIYVGSLSHWKGIDLLLKAYSALDSKEWGLLLVGKDTTDGDYLKMVKELKIEDKVTFTGAVNFDRINEYISFADVFVLPTRFDGWGAVLNEAASLAKPIISTDECGAAYHLIEEDKNGYMVKAGALSSLKNAMQHYVDKPELIIDHGKYSATLFQAFLPEKNVQRLLNAVTLWTDK